MLFKTFFATVIAAASVSAHSTFNQPLGVTGTPTRNDVGRSSGPVCNNKLSAANLDSTTPIPIAADGTFQVVVQNYNAGADGSTAAKSIQVDGTGTGKSFTAATVTTNGNPKPAKVGPATLTVQMPAGVQCTGGTAGNLCVANGVTTAGFSNCFVLQQGGGGAAAASSNATAAAAGSAGNSTAAAAGSAGNSTAAASTGAAAGGKGKGKGKGKRKAAKAGKGAQKQNARGVGSAAAQAGAFAKARREEPESFFKRAVSRFFLKEMA